MLSLGDLGVVLTELYSVRDRWYNVGLQLQVPVTELQRIESEHKNDQITCLRQMLVKWLESGHANWRFLCNALNSPIVLGQDAALVNNLMKKYCEVGEKEPNAKKRKLCEAEPAATTIKKPKVDLPDTFDPVDFVNPPPGDRLCNKCRRVPTNPQSSACCGTVYCVPCSRTLPPSYCTLHGQPQRYTDNKSLRTKILDLRSRCPNWKSGCKHKDAVSKVYRKHLPECTPQPDGGSCDEGEKFPSSKPTSTTITKQNEDATTKNQPGKICCIFAKQGCEWMGELDSLSQHVQDCKIRSARNSAEVKEEKPVVPQPDAKQPARKPTGSKDTTANHQQLRQTPTVRCVYVSKGCQWTGELNDLPQHAQMCEKHLVTPKPIKTEKAIGHVSQAPHTEPDKGSCRSTAMNNNQGSTASAVAPSSSNIARKDQHIHPTKTEVSPALPKTTIPSKLHSTKVEKSSYSEVKQEHRQPTFGDLTRSQIHQGVRLLQCKYQKAIGCPHSVAPDQMYQHLQDNMLTHLDLAIAKIQELQRRLDER